MSRLDEYRELVTDLITVHGMTQLQVSDYLKVTYGQQHGFSEWSVRQFCKNHGITAAGRNVAVSDDHLAVAVSDAIAQLGPSYGRKMMTGYLASQGLVVSECRVGQALQHVNEEYNQARQQGARNFNPIPYYAEYFGHKLHIDQNEKIEMFGCVHVAAIDGFSSMIVAWKCMPVKNNLIIYDHVYRSSVLKHGIWYQIRVDHGTEFYLSLYMQWRNAALRYNTGRQPYIQTQSTRSHMIERIWPEVNQRVNYPIKRALVQLVDADLINMDNDVVKFCISSLCCWQN